ncbi:nucleophosmin-like [Phycodurus eques]|uniref:nucleophosmin-like n=1 Tax=Phycodurus eques TaxID=693459 RepID=UPI002ACEB494|nr:nucleophosmin-like [Phycodurus eques]
MEEKDDDDNNNNNDDDDDDDEEEEEEETFWTRNRNEEPIGARRRRSGLTEKRPGRRRGADSTVDDVRPQDTARLPSTVFTDWEALIQETDHVPSLQSLDTFSRACL